MWYLSLALMALLLVLAAAAHDGDVAAEANAVVAEGRHLFGRQGALQQHPCQLEMMECHLWSL